MKVFVVQNIDGEVCKTFLNKEAAVAWCNDQCRNWAKNMGETSEVFVDHGSDTHVIADENGNEETVRLPATAVNCKSGSEYTITETVVDMVTPQQSIASLAVNTRLPRPWLTPQQKGISQCW